MPIRIPELEGYFGGKGGSGVYQNIINLIPPHDILVVPFLGHCGIIRNIRPARLTIANDVDPFVIKNWANYYAQNRYGRHEPSEFVDNIIFRNQDWSAFFMDPFIIQTLNRPGVFIYFDPPYPKDTRKSNHRYRFEMNDQDHKNLLFMARNFDKANMIFSTYDNKLYRKELEGFGWRKKSFRAQTRNGTATETIYFNYPPPTSLHDYQYFGNNYKSREHYRLKRDRLLEKFRKMTPVEQTYYWSALNDEIINSIK